jgi:DNA-binding transcriptional LysR family regulator
MMNFNKLKSLMYVAELGSVSAASIAMHLTQAAVSQHLKDLEEELGSLLVDRTRRPVSLTKEGEELVAVTRQMLRQWNEYTDRKRNADLGGELVLGHVRSAITGTVANSLAFLRAKHPRLKIRLVVGSGISKSLALDVVSRKIDASFGVGPLHLPEELLWRPYCQERLYVIASSRYRGKTDEDLLKLGMYLRHKHPQIEETIIDREMKRRGIKVDAIMEFDSYDAILLMVEHGAGVGIVPESNLSPQKFQELHCVSFGNPPFTREMGLMVRSDSPNLYLVNLLWEAIKEFSLPSPRAGEPVV